MSLLQKIAKLGRRVFEKLERMAQPGVSSIKSFTSYAEAKKSCSTESPYQDTDLVEVIFAKTVRYVNSLPCDNSMSQDQLNSCFFLTQFFGKSTITVIDIGGACGAHYFFLRKILPDTVHLVWRVVETPEMVKKASQLTTNELSFHSSIQEASQSDKIDVVIASGVLPYVPDPYNFLENIIEIAPNYISIHRTFFIDGVSDVIDIRKSYLSENGIGPLPECFTDREVEYPETTLGLNKFRSKLESNYELMLEWDRQRENHMPGRERFVFSFLYRLKTTLL